MSSCVFSGNGVANLRHHLEALEHRTRALVSSQVQQATPLPDMIEVDDELHDYASA